MSLSSRARRQLLAIAAALALVAVPAGIASAHVSVSSPDAAPGGFGMIVFRVPNESEAAYTTQLTVDLPTDTPLAFVSTGVNPGWTATTEMTTLDEPIEVFGLTFNEVVSSVTWTADGEGLAPHQFTEFALSVGPLPDVDTLSFPATQVYSDGETVEWNEPTPESGEEPEHPAPTLALTAAGTDADSSSDSSDGSDTLTLVLAIVGVLLGGAALAVGLSARRSRSVAG